MKKWDLHLTLITEKFFSSQPETSERRNWWELLRQFSNFPACVWMQFRATLFVLLELLTKLRLFKMKTQKKLWKTMTVVMMIESEKEKEKKLFIRTLVLAIIQSRFWRRIRFITFDFMLSLWLDKCLAMREITHTHTLWYKRRCIF